jgi:hypothetical protein
MTDPIDDEENYPPRPRWIGWLIGLVMVASALGVANIGWRIMRVSTAEKAADALVAAKPELAAARSWWRAQIACAAMVWTANLWARALRRSHRSTARKPMPRAIWQTRFAAAAWVSGAM